MEAITVEPVNESIRLSVEAIKIKNEFVKMGFRGGGPIVSLLGYSAPEIAKKYTETEMHNFWNLRIKKPEMIKDLQMVIEKLKAE